MEIDRRTTLVLLGAGVLSSKIEAMQQRLQFFTEAENALIDRVAEMILPADNHSPGAHEAKVSYYIDLVVAHSPEATQKQWRERLEAFDRLALSRHGKPFVDLDEGRQAGLLNEAAEGEEHPASPAGHFFADMKKMTLVGYYTSEIGLRKELEYKGTQVRAAFPGCRHPPAAHK